MQHLYWGQLFLSYSWHRAITQEATLSRNSTCGLGILTSYEPLERHILNSADLTKTRAAWKLLPVS